MYEKWWFYGCSATCKVRIWKKVAFIYQELVYITPCHSKLENAILLLILSNLWKHTSQSSFFLI